MENLTPVTLVVKAPNQKIADQTVECALNWTVQKLKQHLAAVYPSKPVETQQRIIYSGQLLQDHLTLKDVLRQYEPNQTIHTVHLVCSPTTSVEGPSFYVPPSTTTTADSSNAPTSDGLRQRHSHVAETHTTAAQQAPIAGLPNPPTPFAYNMMAQNYSPEQMLWLQHSYAQYMAQYMHYYQAGLYSPLVMQQVAYESYVNPMANVNILPNNFDMNQPGGAVADAAVNRVAMPRQARGPEIVRMNAQGGPVVNDEDDDMQNRDWLDWVYVSLRIGILICILYFYSTFGRVVATLVLVLFIYLYQVGWFQLHRRNAPPVVPQPVAAPAAEAQPRPAEESDSDGEAPQSDATTTQPAVPQGPVQPSGLAVAWTFVVSFFSSLAPQEPPPVNVN